MLVTSSLLLPATVAARTQPPRIPKTPQTGRTRIAAPNRSLDQGCTSHHFDGLQATDPKIHLLSVYRTGEILPAESRVVERMCKSHIHGMLCCFRPVGTPPRSNLMAQNPASNGLMAFQAHPLGLLALANDEQGTPDRTLSELAFVAPNPDRRASTALRLGPWRATPTHTTSPSVRTRRPPYRRRERSEQQPASDQDRVRAHSRPDRRRAARDGDDLQPSAGEWRAFVRTFGIASGRYARVLGDSRSMPRSARAAAGRSRREAGAAARACSDAALIQTMQAALRITQRGGGRADAPRWCGSGSHPHNTLTISQAPSAQR